MSPPSKHGSSLLSGRIPGLDGLRALSILVVLFGHFGFKKVVPGGLGVTIFFFISGFLITALLLEERASRGTISVKNFYVRRFLRLAPEMLLLIAVVSLAGLAIGRPLHVQDYAGALTYTTNYIYLWEIAHFGQHHLHWPHMWSLAVEEHFYLTYPLLFLALSAWPKRLATVLVLVCVACLGWRITALNLNFVDGYTYVASDSRFDSIAYGCLFAILLRSDAFVAKVRGLGLPLIAAGGLLLVFSIGFRDPFFRESFRYSIQGLAMGLIVTGMLASPSGGFLVRLLEFKPMVVLGQLSYGAYLWHLDVVSLYAHFAGGEPASLAGRAALAVGGSAASFGIAYLSYTLVAKRFLALRHRFRGHPERQQPGNLGPSVEKAEGAA